MLHLADILKFKTCFGKLWLAGTIGAKKRPFNKGIILGSNIEEFVEAMFSVDVPLAPRLCGTLLCGVCKIYDQKCHLLCQNVLALYRKLCSEDTIMRVKISSHINRLKLTQGKKKGQRMKELEENICQTIEKSSELEALLADLNSESVVFLPEDTQDKENEETLNLLLQQDLWDKNADSENEQGGLSPYNKDDHLENFLTDVNEDKMSVDTPEYSCQHESNSSEIDSLEVKDNRIDLISENHNFSTLGYNGLAVEISLDKEQETSLNRTPSPLSEQMSCEKISANEHIIKKPRLKRFRQKRQTLASLMDSKTVLSDSVLMQWQQDLSNLQSDPFPDVLKSCFSNNDYFLKMAPRLEKFLNKKIENSTTSRVKEPTKNNEQEFRLDILPEEQFRDIERLRGIFNPGLFDVENYDTTLRLNPRRGTTIRHSLHTDSTSLNSLYSNERSFDRTFQLKNSSVVPNERESVSSSCFQPNLMNIQTPSRNKNLLLSRQSTLMSTKKDENVDPTTSIEMYPTFNNNLRTCYTVETWKFRTFVESQLKKSIEANISFYNLIPLGKVDSLIAARSFYNLLVLASLGDISVHEENNEIFIWQEGVSNIDYNDFNFLNDENIDKEVSYNSHEQKKCKFGNLSSAQLNDNIMSTISA